MMSCRATILACFSPFRSDAVSIAERPGRREGGREGGRHRQDREREKGRVDRGREGEWKRPMDEGTEYREGVGCKYSNGNFIYNERHLTS